METKTHWKKLYNPNYLGAYSLDPGEERVLTIKKVTTQMLMNGDGKEEECTVCYFEGDSKPMILNKTNASTIAKVCESNYIEDWPGHRIQIYSAKVKAFGQMVEALRVRPMKPKGRRKLDSGQYKRMMAAIKAGKLDPNQALSAYALNPEQKKQVEEYV